MITKQKSLLIALVGLSTVALSSCCGCGRSKSQNSHTLTSHSWSLIELDGDKINNRPEADSYTLTFDESDNTMFGKGSANNYFGSYAVSDVKKLNFSNVGSTKMMAPQQEVEDEFNQTMSEIDSYTIDGDMLMLLENGDVEMIFKAIPKINR